MSEQRGRPFEPGNTQGRGRPKGSRNKAKSPVQELLEEYSMPLMRKCIVMAGQGDMRAMQIVMDRILPVRRGAFIGVGLPRIKTVQDVAKAAAQVMRSIARGKITPADGEKVMNTLEIQSRILEEATFEIRIDKLDADQAAGGLPRAA